MKKYGEYLYLDLPSLDRAPISLSFSLTNLVIQLFNSTYLNHMNYINCITTNFYLMHGGNDTLYYKIIEVG